MSTYNGSTPTSMGQSSYSTSFAQELIETLENGAIDEKLPILALFENFKSEIELHVSVELLFEKLLADPSVEVRIAVVREIERLLLVNDGYVYLLGVALADSDYSVKAQALNTLKKHQHVAHNILPSLLEVVKHTEGLFRVVALNIIASTGTKGSWLIPAVIRCTQDVNTNVIKAAYNALVNIVNPSELQEILSQKEMGLVQSEKYNEVLDKELFCA